MLSSVASVSGHTAFASSSLLTTGEIHTINPVDVDAYVADFEAQRSRISFSFDGVAHSLAFDAADMEGNSIFGIYDDFAVIVGFDFESEESLPTISLVQIDDESDTVTAQWSADDLMLGTTAEEDIIYSGRLKGYRH
jgi:hypothetical protein